MSLIAYPQQRMLWPLPQTIPRQKTYLYILLICFTALLLYFYSYPLNMESWENTKQRSIGDIFESIYKEKSDDSTLYEYDLFSESVSRSTSSILLQKIFLKKIASTSRKFQANENNLHTSDFEKRIGNSEEVLYVTVENSEKDIESFHEVVKDSENSKAKSYTTFDRITKEFVNSLPATKSVKHEDKPEDKASRTFEKRPKERGNESYQSSNFDHNTRKMKENPPTLFEKIAKLNVNSLDLLEFLRHKESSKETSTTLQNTVKEQEPSSLQSSELIKDVHNSNKNPPAMFRKRTEDLLTYTLPDTEFDEPRDSSKTSSPPFQKITKDTAINSEMYQPEEYFEKVTTTVYVTKKLQSLPTSETVKYDEDFEKASPSATEKVERESDFTSTSELAKNAKNSEETSLTALTTQEQVARGTPIQLSIADENAKKLVDLDYSSSETTDDDASTTEAIEEHDSATDKHKIEIKETTYSSSYPSFKNDLREEYTTAKNNNLKFADADSITVSTMKKKTTSNATSYNDFTKVTNVEAMRKTRVKDGYTTVLESTNMESKLDDHTVSNTAKETTDTVTHVKNVTSVVSGVQNGFLVFSENCRIPDLDPMHSSIRHLIEKTPPLDCSKDYKRLTWTEGHFLRLNQTAIRERTSGENYSCCYKTVERKNDGESDDDVETGKECKEIFDKGIIQDEFITVECTINKNRTTFYRDFHSFIHDKSEVEKRCSKHSDSQYSVLIIGADAMSRMNMHRQLNRTAQYLLKEMGAIEMYGFNKVGDNTFPNLIPLLVGYDERELPTACWESSDMPLDKCNFIWKRFAEKGYRTFYAEDSPHISSFNYIKKGFYHQPTDYYFRHFILAYEDALGRDKPLNCYLCVGSLSETEAVLHWTEQFASHFSDRPYFAFSWINSLTHDYLNLGSSGDHMYENFFRFLHQKGALNKTIVILMGDHGMRWGSIRDTYIGRLEERLPMLMIALPQSFKQEHPEFTKILKQNSHRLVTPFDLHATLVHLLNRKSNWSFTNPDKISKDLETNFTKRAQSLFQLIAEDRSCDDAFIEEHWCTCETSLEADISSSIVKQVANFLVNHVNNLLKPVSQKCAHLTLDTISDARLWQPPSEHEGHSADDSIYTVVIHVKPSGAVFEGTMKISASKGTNELLGTISRLNLYGNQSSCVDNAVLRKYCYCL